MELHGWREDLGVDDGCTVCFMINEKGMSNWDMLLFY